MSNKIIIAAVGLVVVTGVFLVLSGSSKEETSDVSTSSTGASVAETETAAENPTQQTKEVESEEAVGDISALTNAGTARFVEYDDRAIAASSGTKRVLFFHADWCSLCVYYEGQILDQGVPSGITIIKANYDTEKELKKQYGINVQSTFVLLDENGDAVQTWPFAAGLKEIQDLYDAV